MGVTRNMNTGGYIPVVLFILSLVNATRSETPEQHRAAVRSWIIRRMMSKKNVEPYKMDFKEDKFENPFENDILLHKSRTLGGKKWDEMFFPFPDNYLQKIISGSQAGSIPINPDNVEAFPQDMKYLYFI